MRYFFEISYDGSAYNGWQRQSNTSNTIQEIIEKKISLISGSQTTIVGCGRTDKAVHARSFYFHVDFKDFNPETYTYKLNRMLPEDICIKGIYRVSDSAHARFSAVSRSYEYHFHWVKNVFLDKKSLELGALPDFKKLESALQIISEQSDFRFFCKTPDRHNNTLCKILSPPELIHKQGNSFMIRIQANRFLKSMNRALLFYVLEVAFGRLTLKGFENSFNLGRGEQLEYLPPDGLYLSQIKYEWD